MDDVRECSVCQLPMTSGFVVQGGEAYFCSNECLPFTEEEWEEMYDDGNSDSYWTEWEGEKEVEGTKKIWV